MRHHDRRGQIVGATVGALLAAVWATGAAFLLWTVAVLYLVAATGLGPAARDTLRLGGLLHEYARRRLTSADEVFGTRRAPGRPLRAGVRHPADPADPG